MDNRIDSLVVADDVVVLVEKAISPSRFVVLHCLRSPWCPHTLPPQGVRVPLSRIMIIVDYVSYCACSILRNELIDAPQNEKLRQTSGKLRNSNNATLGVCCATVWQRS